VPRYIGQPICRLGDDRLLSGNGRYVDDLRFPGLLHVAFVRSTHAHARVRGVDVAAASALPGVVAVFTAADLAGVGDVPANAFVPGLSIPPMPPLARDRVRFVGEPIAAVVAESRYAAQDGAEAATVDYDPLPVVASVEAALAAEAIQLHDQAEGNVAYRYSRSGGDVDGAFARAAHVVTARARHHRIAGVPLEPRGLVAMSVGDELTVWISHQGPHELRGSLAGVLEVPETRIRVVVPDLGGGFGLKAGIYREDVVICALAMRLGRPVKWHSTRSEDFMGTIHSRDQDDRIEGAFDAEGRLQAIRTHTTTNLGAYIQGRASRPPLRVAQFSTGAYKVAAHAAEIVTVYTNTLPSGPYRGAGRPEAAYIIERLMDTAARQLGIDPVELRRQNYLQPGDFPWTTPTGSEFDSGDYPRLLAKALEVADYPAWIAERDRRRAAGEIVGVGLATFIENTANGWETGSVRVEPDGSVTAMTGSINMGQGILTVLAQIVAEKLGVPIDRVRVVSGDTASVPSGVGSFGSRSTALGGSALALASDRIIDRVLDRAATMLEAPREDLEYVEGVARVRGAPERSVTLEHVARSAYPDLGAPIVSEPGLFETASFGAPGESIAAGAYLVMVSIDADTGRVMLERLTAVDDSGVLVNPMIVHGQVMGAIAQGVGEALSERIVYDDDGQLLTGSLLDYAMPVARGVPDAHLDHTTTPSTRNPLGIKGAGEAGALGTPPAVANAVADALAPFGVGELQPPFTEEKVWRALQSANEAAHR
jgi:carbon-monoxide dehydrogenase large subunit